MSVQCTPLQARRRDMPLLQVTAIWEYDKRSANGANFVYFGMRLRSSLGEREKALVAYAKQVVNALHIVQGPSHMEVILTPTGPCLVEVGSRCHGGEVSGRNSVAMS